MTQSDGMGGAVIFHHHRVIDRNVGGALLELTNRISPRAHHFGYKVFGHGDGRLRIVDKPGLDLFPTLFEMAPISFREGTDFELFPAFFAELEHALGLSRVAFLLQYAIVFRAETLAEFLTAALARHQKRDHGDGDDGNDQHNQELLIVIHESSLRVRESDATWDGDVV